MSTKAIVLAVLAALLVLSLLVAGACYLSYRAGQNTVELKYQKILTDMSVQSEKSKLSLKAAENEVKHYIMENAKAGIKINELRKMARTSVQECDSGASSNAYISGSDFIDGLLLNASADSRLQENRNTGSFTNAAHSTTADRNEYTIYAIGEYNSCADQVNLLIKLVK